MFRVKTLKECGLWSQTGWIQVLTWPVIVCVLGEVTECLCLSFFTSKLE